MSRLVAVEYFSSGNDER